ncbi:hypothetical protein MATL_G00163150 [Megalops atlanticus]|uniref:Uncharacterized protein n=1 Tax=Megalops atlanticus TaxID=7932 RepID=A0A9D3PVA5_MEGAT|nr:hypothetical protein MATL_G00163150 [Megalops atlanticus]
MASQKRRQTGDSRSENPPPPASSSETRPLSCLILSRPDLKSPSAAHSVPCFNCEERRGAYRLCAPDPRGVTSEAETVIKADRAFWISAPVRSAPPGPSLPKPSRKSGSGGKRRDPPAPCPSVQIRRPRSASLLRCASLSEAGGAALSSCEGESGSARTADYTRHSSHGTSALETTVCSSVIHSANCRA